MMRAKPKQKFAKLFYCPHDCFNTRFDCYQWNVKTSIAFLGDRYQRLLDSSQSSSESVWETYDLRKTNFSICFERV